MTNAPLPLNSPVPLNALHDVSAFACGAAELSTFLQKFALMNQQSQASRTYVATRGNRVVGYYTLAAGSVGREHAPQRITMGLAKHPIPVVLLARLAVDQSEQGKGLGGGLLRDALRRATQAAEIIGCRAVLVHAKDEQARTFYEKFGFEPSPSDPLHLFLLMKDVTRAIGK